MSINQNPFHATNINYIPFTILVPKTSAAGNAKRVVWAAVLERR